MKRRRDRYHVRLMIALASIVVAASVSADAQSLVRHVVSSGAVATSDGTVTMRATVGQSIAGVVDRGDRQLYHGFWGPLPSAPTSVAVGVDDRQLWIDRGQLDLGDVRGPIRVVLVDLLGRTVADLYGGDASGLTAPIDLAHPSLPTGNYLVVVAAGGENRALPVTIVR